MSSPPAADEEMSGGRCRSDPAKEAPAELEEGGRDKKNMIELKKKYKNHEQKK